MTAEHFLFFMNKVVIIIALIIMKTDIWILCPSDYWATESITPDDYTCNDTRAV